jgi:hypothetical protein
VANLTNVNIATKTAFIRNYFGHQQEWSDTLNLGGYTFLTNGILSTTYITPTASESKVNQTLEPFREYTFKTLPVDQLQWYILTRPSFYEWKRTFIPPTTENFANGARVEPISRLVPKSKLKSNLRAISLWFASQSFVQFQYVSLSSCQSFSTGLTTYGLVL